MHKLTTFCSALLLLAAVGCGDNLAEDSGDETIVIIPAAGESLMALESAERAGFSDPAYDEDHGYIIAFGSLSLADQAIDMPGIDDVISAEDIDSWNDRVQWNGELALDGIEAPAQDEWDDRVEWDGNLARIPEPTEPRDPQWNMRAPWHGQSKAER